MHRQGGFTLIETAIVLVIVGLIVGGVLMGRYLMHASELRSVVSDIGKYKTALGEFKAKYDFLPGDFPQAETYWGSDAACPNTPSNTVPKVETCNGNGDGRIGYQLNAALTLEWFRAWQQLADAGFIENLYTGAQGAASVYQNIPGVNAPASKLSGGSYMLFYWAETPDADFFNANKGNMIMFGRSDGTIPVRSIMSSEDAWEIDLKTDDGRPGFGKVITTTPASAWGEACATTSVAATANYDIANANRICHLVFVTGY